MLPAVQRAPRQSRSERSAFRVTLTRGPVVVSKWGLSSGLLCPPIGPAYVAATLREGGYPVTLVDPVGEAPFEVHAVAGRDAITHGWSLPAIVDHIPADTRCIGVSCMFSHEWPVSRELVLMIRERFPHAAIVAGGEHMTAVPEASLRDCPAIDHAVLGEGEETLLELVDAIEQGGDPTSVPGLVCRQNGGFVRTAHRHRMRDLDGIPKPAWDLVPMENYLHHGLSYGVGQGRTMPILATRGCPYECTFCSNPAMWTTRWYARNPTAVADEIESYVRTFKATNFDFYDLTAIIRKDWIKAFCEELMQRKLSVSWQLPAGTRSEAVDHEVSRMLAQSGHRNLVYATESGSERMLKVIKKKVKPARMIDSMRGAIASGISVKLNMIFGFPMETRADIFRSYRFLARVAWLGVDDVTIATFTPYPGSQLFEDLRKSGRITELDDDYYFDLLSIGDAKHAASFCADIGPRELLVYRLGGVFLFYALSYLRRPQRLVQTAWHLYRGDHHTRLEKALDAILARFRLSRRIRSEAAPALD